MLVLFFFEVKQFHFSVKYSDSPHQLPSNFGNLFILRKAVLPLLKNANIEIKYGAHYSSLVLRSFLVRELIVGFRKKSPVL